MTFSGHGMVVVAVEVEVVVEVVLLQLVRFGSYASGLVLVVAFSPIYASPRALRTAL